MKVEHFAINVSNPVGMTDWYVEHMGLKVIRQEKEAPYTAFLADDGGRVMLEVYNNPPAEVPDYENMNPLIVHIAFVSENPAEDKKRLVEAGASLISDDQLEDGSHLVMLRDPWGLSLQLCKRSVSMLT